MNVCLLTFGCKVNQYDSQVILEDFLNNGFTRTSDFSKADVVVINSCTVTEESSKKAFNFISKVKKSNPSTVTALIGCIPQAFPEVQKRFSQADIILGNKNKFQILSKVKEYLDNKKKISEIISYTNLENCETSAINDFDGHTRAFIKIEDGCNQFCSYCIIPFARGSKIRSKSLESIQNQVKALVYKGYKEIVLVGINLCVYGKDLNSKTNICDVVEKISQVKEVKRIRLGSLDSQFFDPLKIERLSKLEKFCEHFHLSLQSGCDRTLKRMNRRYTTRKYIEIIDLLRKNFDNVSITTDIMVGFPGETEQDFKDSLNFVEKVGFYKVHVFPYSERKGTKAEKFLKNEKLDKTKKNLRCREMIVTTKKMQSRFLNSQVGKTVSVLFEKDEIKGLSKGHARNYVPVVVNSNLGLGGKILNVKIEKVKDYECYGKIC